MYYGMTFRSPVGPTVLRTGLSMTVAVYVQYIERRQSGLPLDGLRPHQQPSRSRAPQKTRMVIYTMSCGRPLTPPTGCSGPLCARSSHRAKGVMSGSE